MARMGEIRLRVDEDTTSRFDEWVTRLEGVVDRMELLTRPRMRVPGVEYRGDGGTPPNPEVVQLGRGMCEAWATPTRPDTVSVRISRSMLPSHPPGWHWDVRDAWEPTCENPFPPLVRDA